ncbi:MAG: indolepyruvate ferredoxin oxidoreductase subunit alpha [Thermoplasmata archaeon]|nr:MAG: indolepyruvate ferredoxin oxidoreductase subunit alpha [Thermoplasmata archaeon]
MELLGVGKKILLGNEAIARGALEADVDIATTYPGTPSSEIADSLSAVARYLKSIGEEPKFYFQYSVNEKVALEFAAASAVSGLRALTCMKHVGMNVASDAFMTYAYVGCKGGHVIVTADDPSCHSSQNEQDNRLYAKFASLPMLEPSSPQEAKDMTMEAFKLSEELELPVILRTTTRISHTRGVVECNEFEMSKKHGKFEKNGLMVTVPDVARKLHPILLEKMEKAERISEESKFNIIEDFGGEDGIITSGVSYNYVREAIDDLGIKCKLLKLGMSYPLPRKKIIDFMNGCRRILIVEELEPFLEEQIMAIAKEEGVNVIIYGKGYSSLSRCYEYTPDIVGKAMADFFGMEWNKKEMSINVAPRPPVLCPGCPHRATYYAVKQVAPPDTIYPTDIGCYTLGLLPPYKTADFLLCMGSSFGSACGFSHATKQKVIAFIGDSTFYHAGLPPLVNAVHHNHDFVAIILDNSTTAMTGHQPHPGSNVDGMGNETMAMDMESVVRGLGVKHIEVVDPRNIEQTKEAVKRALEFKGLSVIISKAPCILLGRKKRERVTYEIDQDKCKKCKICITKFACPAFYFDEEDIKINESLCTGCGVCVQICPFNAIGRKSEGIK